MITKEQKKQVVEEIKEKLKKCQVAILANNKGLNVAQATKLRNLMRESGNEYKVAKNTLTKIAADELGIEGLDEYLVGPTTITFGYGDPASSAKILHKFARENKVLEIKVGVLEGSIIDVAKVKELADLPSREVLLGKVVGGFQAPIYGLVNVLQGNIRNLVYVLDAVRKQKAENAS